MAKIGMTLEIELGITGGEEDGVDNSDVDQAELYTQPEEVAYAYERLSEVSPFTVAAAFGNMHGVYKPGNVKLTPPILRDAQDVHRRASSAPATEAGQLRVPRRLGLDGRPRSPRRSPTASSR